MMLAFFFLLLSSLYSASFQLLTCIFTPSKQHLYTFQASYSQTNLFYPPSDITSEDKNKYPQHLVNRYCGYF